MNLSLWLFSAAVLSVAFAPQLPPLSWLLPVLIAVAPCALYRPLRLPALLVLVLGLAWGSFWGHTQLAHRLPPALDRQDFHITGTVMGLPDDSERRSRFLLAVEAVQPLSGNDVPDLKKIRLSWYGARPRVEPGQRWRFEARLRSPRGFANPGGFDYAGWLLGEGISATGYVRGDGELLSQGQGAWLDRWRMQLSRQMTGLSDSPAVQGFMAALVLGDKSRIPSDNWRQLVSTGTVHLLVVSGLHIGMVAGFGYLLGLGVGRVLAALGAGVPATSVAALTALLLASGYGAVAGMGLPVRRALVMTAVVMVALLLRRRIGPWVGLGWALCLVAVVDPLAAIRPGFWLSFTAVAGLLAWFAPRPPGRRWSRLLVAQGVVFLVLLAVLLLYQGQVYLTAPVINLVAIPWVSIAIVPLCLLGLLFQPLPALATACWRLAAIQMEWVETGLARAAALGSDFRWQPANSQDPWLIAGLALAALVLLLPRGLGLRPPVLLMVFALVLASPPAGPPLSVTVLDVGQGLATVVRVGDKVLVYDTGPSYSPRFDAGSGILVPFLRARGIAEVDTLVISHGHDDHNGGTEGFLRAMTPARLLTGEPDLSGAGDRPHSRCQRGQGWYWHNVRVDILHPAMDRVERESNNRSCVVRIRYRDISILLTGDIEAPVERRLLSAGLLSSVDLLVAPHHGSRTSSTPAFVAATSPAHVVYSAGYNHHWGHPHPEVQARYRDQGARAWHTAHGGAITFTWSAGGKLAVSEHRRQHRRYWH